MGLDIIVLAVVVVSLLVGCMRGLMYEAAMLCGWVIAFFIARAFAPELAAVFANAIANESWRMGIAFVVIFIAVLFANGILAFALKAIFSKSVLRPVDRCLGGVFGLLRAGVILLALTLVVFILRLEDEPWWAQSYSAPVLNEAMDISRPYLRSVLNLDDTDLAQNVERINQGYELLSDRIQDSVDATP